MKINKLFGHKTLRCTNTAASSRERRTKANFVSGHNLHEQDFALHLATCVTHCYWFCSVPAGKFHTSHFTDIKHPLVPPRVEFWLIPGRSGHSSRFRWVSTGIPIPAGIEIKHDQPILSQHRSPEETHLITAVFFFFFFSFSVHFILYNFLSNSCCGYFLPGSTFYCA